MRYRVVLLSLVAIALAGFLAVPAIADKGDKADKADKNSHEGTFVGVKAGTTNDFIMKDKSGKNHEHKLSSDAKVLGSDGKDCKLTDMKPGQKIRVTTKDGDMATVTKVEAMKEK